MESKTALTFMLDEEELDGMRKKHVKSPLDKEKDRELKKRTSRMKKAFRVAPNNWQE